MDEELTFGQWLRRSRKARDLTQTALARQVSCALSTIRKLEADELRPSKPAFDIRQTFDSAHLFDVSHLYNQATCHVHLPHARSQETRLWMYYPLNQGRRHS